MHPWVLKQFKKKPRIYIMPTRMGGYLNGLVFLMFLLSVGYSNNLLLIFTLFLFGLNLIWVIQTHFHLHALKLQSVSIHDGFTAENTLVELFWKKTPDVPHKWNFRLFGENFDLKLSALENASSKSLTEIVFPKRGVWRFEHLRVSTEMPFGLYKAWIYFPIEAKGYAYPARLIETPPINVENSFNDGEFATSRSGPHDVWNLGPYQGEESRRISWKHYARTGDLVVKEGEDFSNAVVHFRLPVGPDNKEYLLSKLTTMMVQCSKSDVPFSFENKSASLSARHLTDCLRELSQC
jgi:uncharacterized protein (DUF58 family)